MASSVKEESSVLLANEKLVRLTSRASKKISELIQREKGGDYLRIRITGGGCNGLSYKMKFVDTPRNGDLYLESEGSKVLVDSKTALYLRGTTLDYSDKMVAGGFKFSNPNAKASCSCGESFNL
jgi:iron-sulfur cluster assembly protein